MAAIWRSQVSGGAAIWSPSNGDGSGGGPVTPPVPTLVDGIATGATTYTVTITDASGGTAAHRVQVRTVGGAYADAVGSTNPMPAGVLVFNGTGRPAGLQQEAQARAERSGLNSAYVGSAAWYQDVGVGGGGEIGAAGGAGAQVGITSAGAGLGIGSSGGAGAQISIASAGMVLRVRSTRPIGRVLSTRTRGPNLSTRMR